MNNGLGDPQSIVLFGGTSDIGLAIARRLVRPTTSRLVLASRDVVRSREVVSDLSAREGLDVAHVVFDASDPSRTEVTVEEVGAFAGDIDVAIVAQGVLDEGRDILVDTSGIVDMAAVNFTTPMVLLSLLAARMRQQGYGTIVLVSSVAGVRPRRANAPYGATKSGIDGFALALDHLLEGSGVSLVVVRPGFVESKMTAGMTAAPFSTTPTKVAEATERGIRTGARVVWVPGILRYVFGFLRVLPTGVWRRLPL